MNGLGEKFMYLGYGNGALAVLGGNYESKGCESGSK